MKVWRNSEGREFPASFDKDRGWYWDVSQELHSASPMEILSYELVEKDPEEFEVECLGSSWGFCDRIGKDTFRGELQDSRIKKGKTYLVREKV